MERTKMIKQIKTSLAIIVFLGFILGFSTAFGADAETKPKTTQSGNSQGNDDDSQGDDEDWEN